MEKRKALLLLIMLAIALSGLVMPGAYADDFEQPIVIAGLLDDAIKDTVDDGETAPAVEVKSENADYDIAGYLPANTLVYSSVNIENYKKANLRFQEVIGEQKMGKMFDAFKELGIDYEQLGKDLDELTKEWFEGEIALIVGDVKEFEDDPEIAVIANSKSSVIASENFIKLIEFAQKNMSDWTEKMDPDAAEDIKNFEVNFNEVSYGDATINCFISPEKGDIPLPNEANLCWTSVDKALIVASSQNYAQKLIDSFARGKKNNKFVSAKNSLVQDNYTFMLYVEGKRLANVIRPELELGTLEDYITQNSYYYDDEYYEEDISYMSEEEQAEYRKMMEEEKQARKEEQRQYEEEVLKPEYEEKKKNNDMMLKELDALDGLLLTFIYGDDLSLQMDFSVILDKENVGLTEYVKKVTDRFPAGEQDIDEYLNTDKSYVFISLNNITDIVQMVKDEMGDDYENARKDTLENTNIDIESLLGAIGDEFGITLLDLVWNKDKDMPEMDVVAALEIKDRRVISEVIDKVIGLANEMQKQSVAMRELDQQVNIYYECTDSCYNLEDYEAVDPCIEECGTTHKTPDEIYSMQPDTSDIPDQVIANKIGDFMYSVTISQLDGVLPQGDVLSYGLTSEHLFLALNPLMLEDFMSSKKGNKAPSDTNLKFMVNPGHFSDFAKSMMELAEPEMVRELDMEENSEQVDDIKGLILDTIDIFGPLTFSTTIRKDSATISVRQEMNEQAIKDLDYDKYAEMYEIITDKIAQEREESTFYDCRWKIENIKWSQESYYYDHDYKYAENLDDLATYYSYECYDMDPSECVGKVEAEILSACSDVSLKVTDDNFEATGHSKDATGCAICVNKFGVSPEDYKECADLGSEPKCLTDYPPDPYMDDYGAYDEGMYDDKAIEVEPVKEEMPEETVEEAPED